MQTLPPVLSDIEYAKLMRTCDTSDLGKRDAAILSVLRWGGLRRAEVCGLTIDSYDPGRTGDDAWLTVGTVQHHTKKLRQIRIPLHPETVDAIDTYLRQRGDEPGALFLSHFSQDRHLTPNGITQMMEKRRKLAGINHRIGIHSFRRCCAIDLLRKGVSESAVMDMFNWEDASMVRVYRKAARQELSAAAIRATFPQEVKAPAKPRLRRVV